MGRETARPRASADDVHARLRADVLGGLHSPGQKLKFADLCERYSASVSSVREALTRLVGQGLVENEPMVGFRVVQVSPEGLRDLTDTRVEIERLALRQAVERGDVAWESEVVAALHRLERTPMLSRDHGPERISDEWEQTHGRFHATLLSGCGSPRLISIATALRAESELYRRWSQVGEPDRDVAAEHDAIARAAVARDADRACDLLAEHYRHTARIVDGSFRMDDLG